MHGTLEPANSGPVAQLLDWLHGPIYFALLEWGLETDIFSKCVQETRCEPLAEAMDLDPSQLLHLLNGLVAMGLLVRQDEHFKVAPAYSTLLDRQQEANLLPTLKALATLRHDGLDTLAERAAGQTPNEDKSRLFGAAHWEQAVSSLRAFHRAYAGDKMFEFMRELPVWHNANAILDLGAGSSVLARKIIAAAPDKLVTLQDLEPVANSMQSECAEISQVEIFAADYNSALPERRFDLIWASMSLYFVAGPLSSFFERLSDRLRPGGCFVSLHEGLEEARTQPKIHVVGRLMPVLQGKDFSFDKGIICENALAAGFEHESSQSISTQFGPLQLDVLRKPEA